MDGAKGDPLPSNLSEGSKGGSLPPGDGSAGGDMDAFTLLSLVEDMLVSGQGQFRHTGLEETQRSVCS